ncbi:enoyl-CoA hydratase/isomerase family protein [Muricoccus pecuniae]|uniref:Enoyl-CoA hydratase/carnithine racemase n=1 Tax=Muricoccus pecuniae TaxID=693023 RepID=A0A840YID0_9PROT|nr:enoyl-CoA hydratase/isomerase family protein [Roseomonas pecuniae]MBB5696251.1 enoyl-CoA hydratase/carnithine racemase [Roseomonas pecuniae]
MSQVSIRRIGRAAVLSLARPEAGNRITQVLAEELTAALEAARRDPEVAGCVLTGEGSVFCLGGDYRGAGSRIAGRMEFGRAHLDLFDAMARLGKPLVAAVNGHAHAGGFALALSCDLMFLADNATVGLPEAAHGLFPFLALAVARNAMPKAIFFDLAYNARLLNGHEACALHLANEILPPNAVLPRAIEAVERTAHITPDVLTLGRDLYHALSGLGAAEALDQARFALGAALSALDASRDQAEQEHRPRSS